MEDWLELNRWRWDELVPLHVGSELYDVAGFRAGKCTLRPFELLELGDVNGKRLLHLQCHFGLDTLSWARRGAVVTGLDFSEPAVQAAQTLASQVGVAAEFVCANVYDAPAALGRRFDVLYTGLGALIWLPDIRRWAQTLAALAEAGTTLYLSEFHPLTDIFADATLEVKRSYFHDPKGEVWDEAGSYVDRAAATQHTRTIEWVHPVSDVIGALLEAGFRLELFSEHDYTLFPRWPFLVKGPDQTYHLPDGIPRLPLMYSLRARKA